MSNVKERILGAVTVMSDADALKVWELIQATFSLANAESVPPISEELDALAAYHNGDPDYQPHITQEQLIKELGI